MPIGESIPDFFYEREKLVNFSTLPEVQKLLSEIRSEMAKVFQRDEFAAAKLHQLHRELLTKATEANCLDTASLLLLVVEFSNYIMPKEGK